jgi:hypothetical protein
MTETTGRDPWQAYVEAATDLLDSGEAVSEQAAGEILRLEVAVFSADDAATDDALETAAKLDANGTLMRTGVLAVSQTTNRSLTQLLLGEPETEMLALPLTDLVNQCVELCSSISTVQKTIVNEQYTLEGWQRYQAAKTQKRKRR